MTTEADSDSAPQSPSRDDRVANDIGGKISWIIAIAVAFVFLFSWVAPGAIYVLDLLANFQIQWICLFALGAAWQIYRRRFRLAIVLLLLAAWPAIQVGRLYVPADQPEPGSTTVRFLSLNLLHTNDDAQAVVNLIRDVDPDVVNFLECTERWREDLADALNDYPNQISDPYGLANGNLLCSRMPLTKFDDRRLLNNPLLPAICGNLTVDDQNVIVMGVHTTSPTTSRRLTVRDQQIMLLQMVVERTENRYPIVAIGDFNATSGSASIRDLLSMTSLRDSRQGFGMNSSWPAWCWPMQICIDHAFVSDRVHVSERRVERNVGSDHLPIVLDVSFTPEDE